MEIKKIYIKGIPNEEFKDNEYLEDYVKELNEGGVPVVVGKGCSLVHVLTFHPFRVPNMMI